MQKLMISAAILALLAAPALAQPDHRGGPGGPGNGAPQAGPAAAPHAQARPQGGDHGARPAPGNTNRPGNNTRPSPGNNNRPMPGNTNRPGFNPGHNTRPSPGFNRPGPRRDYSSFRNYHQAFRSPRRFRAPAYRRPPGWSYQRWSFGQILPALFWAQQYWLTNYMSYDLPPPPYGAVWVRYGNDALLVDRDTGEIITVQYDVFY